MNYRRLSDDEWFDEIWLMRDPGKCIVSMDVRYRYKTSGLSGDEWRTSVRTQVWSDAKGFVTVDARVKTLEHACAGLYPILYTQCSELHEVVIESIEFRRKEHLSYRSDCSGRGLSLLHAAGHLPWALVKTGDEPLGLLDTSERYCFQPGCSNDAVSLYKLKELYHWSSGHTPLPALGDYHRRFCKLHLRRGDCGLEDADSNYEVICGPGPEGAEGWEKHERKSVFGGIAHLAKEG